MDKRIIYFYIFIVSMATSSSQANPLDRVSREQYTSHKTAVAKKPALQMPSDKAARLEFDFREIEAWLRSDGSWNIDGWVEHSGLRCATYEIGIRFGTGTSGCSEVKWLTQPKYVTSKKHCNNARLRHTGGDDTVVLKSDYEKITCAERLIKCTGTCK